MPEVSPQFETSFQKMVDEEYSGIHHLNADRRAEFPNGMFGITPGATPPRWTPQQLFADLVHTYTTMTKDNRAQWENSFDQIIGIIQTTVNNYIGVLGEINEKTYQNPTQEWLDYEASR